MKEVLSFYIKGGIFYTAFFAIIFSIEKDSTVIVENIDAFLMTALTLGFSLALIYIALYHAVLLVYWLIRRSSPCSYTRSIQINSNSDSAFDRCIKSLDRVSGDFRKTETDRGSGRIVTEQRSFWPDDQVVTFAIESIEDHSALVRVNAKPKSRFTPWDFGFSKDTVDAICRFLNDDPSMVPDRNAMAQAGS